MAKILKFQDLIVFPGNWHSHNSLNSKDYKCAYVTIESLGLGLFLVYTRSEEFKAWQKSKMHNKCT